MPGGLVMVWFRSDLRLTDNPALHFAASTGKPVLPVFVRNTARDVPWAQGQASKWWLHESLVSLDASLREKGTRLILRDGDPGSALTALAVETGADTIVWNSPREPDGRETDAELERQFRRAGISVKVWPSAYLFSPDDIRTREGKPFLVFTPFWNACRAEKPPREPLPAPARLPFPEITVRSPSLDEPGLLPAPDRAEGIRAIWKPGEPTAHKVLDEFLATRAHAYKTDREFPGIHGTSRLSAHLHFGEISPHAVWHRAREANAEHFLRQLCWREFASHLLFHFPHTTDHPLKTEYNRFPWNEDTVALRAWQTGTTGFPFVDAGMRELWSTGWQHNRMRMVTASFLTKDLLLNWTLGARWFWETLVDADLANNTLGWQWVAGCGADAAPYYRVFNPVLQGEKFDPKGEYVSRWIPELAGVSDRFIHRPWDAPAGELRAAGVKLGSTYPSPIIHHEEARKRALAAYASLRRL
ncbi:MAG TPA: deoxyribodipyrimidine photo-lyase [Candidatus Latescibacteria bacterium]|nr:deoxyribodipyrimidine photo-lyase [Candidatus Latescibacterota bacterium]